MTGMVAVLIVTTVVVAVQSLAAEKIAGRPVYINLDLPIRENEQMSGEEAGWGRPMEREGDPGISVCEKPSGKCMSKKAAKKKCKGKIDDKLECSNEKQVCCIDSLEIELQLLNSKLESLESKINSKIATLTSNDNNMKSSIADNTNNVKSLNEKLASDENSMKSSIASNANNIKLINGRLDSTDMRAECPHPWVTIPNAPYGRCYAFSQQMNQAATSWANARNYCKTIGGDLATAGHTRVADGDPLLQYYREKNYARAYVGASKVAGSWQWIDGRSLNAHLDLFSPGNPSGDGDCIEVLDDNPKLGQLNDLGCGGPRNFICETTIIG